MNFKYDIENSIKVYYNKIKNDYTPRRDSTGVEDFVFDVVVQSLTGVKTFTNNMLYSPNKLYKHTKKVLDKWESDLEEFYDNMDDAWRRIVDGSKEDYWGELEGEYDDVEAETGWSGPEDIEDEDVFKHFDKSYFISFASEEISHNIKGRYPIWDNYISKDFDISEMQKAYGSEDIWSSIENKIDDLQQELKDLKSLLNRIKLIADNVALNKRRYIIHIFTGDDFDWEYYRDKG